MSFSNDAKAIQSPESPVIDRRGVIGTLGLAGLGLIASTAASGAAPGPKVSVPTSSRPATQGTTSANCVPALPEEWAARNHSAANQYFRYLSSLKLQRVCPRQVIETHAKQKGNVWNSLPPKIWWNRMGYVLRIVDRIAREMNVNEVEVISAYRAPAYNANCDGARAGSWHQANIAADVKFPVRASQVTATARELRNLGLFRGGVGGYWDFTHIDARGENINW